MLRFDKEGSQQSKVITVRERWMPHRIKSRNLIVNILICQKIIII